MGNDEKKDIQVRFLKNTVAAKKQVKEGQKMTLDYREAKFLIGCKAAEEVKEIKEVKEKKSAPKDPPKDPVAAKEGDKK